MRESLFSTEIIRSLRHIGIWGYKIPDRPITKAILQLTRFTPNAPCDIIACDSSLFIGIETKQFKKWEAFGVRHMEDAQLKGLQGIIDHGGRAFVFLNIRIKKPFENRLIIFEWSDLKFHFDNFGSIYAKELKARPWGHHEVVNGKMIYNLTKWRATLKD